MIPVRKTLRGWVLLCALAPAWAAPATAQRGPGPRAQDRAELERRVRARFAEMMKERLQLTDEQSERLGRTVQDFQQDRMALAREEQALRRRMEALRLEGDASEDEARLVLTRLQDLRLQEARLFRTEQEALLEFLSPVQVVRFHAMREQLAERIRQLRGGPPGPGMVHGGDHPGGGEWLDPTVLGGMGSDLLPGDPDRPLG